VNRGEVNVYLIYGFYFCFNAVCRPAGEAEAVLVRAIQPCAGMGFHAWETRSFRRAISYKRAGKALCGDGDRSFSDGADLCDETSPLFIAENPSLRETKRMLGPVITTTRIGISTAADWPLRFYLDGSASISKKVQPLKIL